MSIKKARIAFAQALVLYSGRPWWVWPRLACSGVAANLFASVLSVTYRYRIPCLGERSTLIIRLIWFNINWLERMVDLFLKCGRLVGVKFRPFKSDVSPERLRYISSDVINEVYHSIDGDSESEVQRKTVYDARTGGLSLFTSVRSYMEVE
jgi:hypothetical protein